MKKLLVLANEFPYGHTEPYMETEEKYYTRFDKTWIASLQLRKTTAVSERALKSNSNIIPVWYKPRWFYLLNSITVLFDGVLYKEISELIKTGRFSMSRIVDLFVFLSRARHEARVIDRALKSEDKSDILIYSYRFEYQPYIAILLKKKWEKPLHIVSRAHRYDIYEEQHKNNYIPLRDYILSQIDCVYPCSEHGVHYIEEKYRKNSVRVESRYLGTVDHGERKYPYNQRKLTIASCSVVAKVKRLEKLVNALSYIRDIDMEWIHYGDGDYFDEIKSYAAEKLGENVKVTFAGNVSNPRLLEEYSERDFFCFLNVSCSEGLPVSIMEVMSFGIPCIATDVGGTKEIVNERNGVLIPVDIEDEKIADEIRKLYELDSERYLALRRNARSFWCEHFDADNNYSQFIEELLSIQAGKQKNN